jgi:hypothetical protein
LAGEDARLKAGLKSAEDELNLIKNQIQQTLLDIREHILDVTNPFNSVVPEMLDDDEEEMTIEDAGGDAGGGDAGGGDEIIEEGDGEGTDDLESLEDSLPPEEEILSEDDGMVGDEYEDVPGDEVIDDGGGGSGGLMDMLEPEPEEEEEDLVEDFELDEEEPETPELEADIEEEEQMEPVLPSDELPIDPEEPMSSGDGVADAVAAALAADVDLLTMASLVRWTAVTRERIGANRLDILLDAYELAGRISPQMKNVVRTLSMLGDEDADGIPVKDIVTAMVRMEGVLNSDENRESNRLLGLLLEMDDDPLDRLAA